MKSDLDMARFSFEICQLGQVDELVAYIDEHWVKNHILVTSRELLDWQHRSKTGDYYNFVMARHNKSGEICGILGFIPTSHFSVGLESEKEVWLAIWKVNEGPKYIGLGFGLLNFLTREFSVRNICSIGISQIVQPMYTTLGYEVGQLTQLALINSELDEYQIACVPERFTTNNLQQTSGYRLKFIPNESVMEELSQPYLFVHKTKKDARYFLNRFVKHPKFKYRIFGIYHQEKLSSFMVTRTASHNECSVIRVVDVQGNLNDISKVSGLLYSLIVDEGHEYLDIMHYGLPESELVDAGFVKVGEDEALIIPDYFQPFVQGNIPIFFARKTAEPEEHFVLFKGDSDQDRPNVI
jgi:hypothetical protein